MRTYGVHCDLLVAMVHRDALEAAQARIVSLEAQLEDLKLHARGEEAARLRELRDECEQLREELKSTRGASARAEEESERLRARVEELTAQLAIVGNVRPFDEALPLLHQWNRSRGGLKLTAMSAETSVQCHFCASLDESSRMRTLPMNFGNGTLVVCPRCGSMGVMADAG